MELTLTDRIEGRDAEAQPLGALGASWVRSFALRAVLVSVLALIPCFWQPRIEAGDLASHVYNAWLVQLIKQGKAPGLWISHQLTNVLFDYALSSFSSLFGFVVAQRIAVSLSVLLFFWSAFAVVSALAGRRPWFLIPCLGMLTYGAIFCLGLFNYYIGLALAFSALACLLRPTPARVALAVALLALGWLGQPLPTLWAICTISYVSIAKKLTPRYRMVPFLLSLLLLFILREALTHYFVTGWSPHQILYVTGADQVVTFGRPYRWIFFALLGLWGVLFARLGKEHGFQALADRTSVQLYALSVVGAFLLPNALLLPGYAASYSGITQRLSLIAAVLACVILSEAKPARIHVGLLSLIAASFFVLMYIDAAALNRLDGKVESVVSQLPPNGRVIGTFVYPQEHGLDISMILDRACVGRCFSYGNYEPSTRQFRVRANPGNSIAAPNQRVPAQVQYSASSDTGPLHEIYACGPELTDLCVRTL
jgi:hypothetical protein